MGDPVLSMWDKACIWCGEDTNWRPIVIVLLLGFLVFVFSGCSTSGDARLSMHFDAEGNSVEVLELRQECPGFVAQGPNGGCALTRPVYVTFNPMQDENVRWHEFDHVAGLIHGAWVRGCARVLVAGQTVWTVGHLLCRNSGGTFYQRAP